MKISDTQKHVLQRMADGWALGTSSGFHTSAWLQEKGLGRGGEVEYIRISTVFALQTKELIVGKWKYPNTQWYLTKRGVASLCK